MRITDRRAPMGALLAASCALSACSLFEPRAGDAPVVFETAGVQTPSTLTVGLYPHVPRIQQFEQAITAAWAQRHPTIALTFLSEDDWDGGYGMDPPAAADVFVFDAMFLDDFAQRGFLSTLAPTEVQDLADFVPYALQGVASGGRYLAIPQLGCANILFYQQADAPLAQASTLGAVNTALNSCQYTSEIPPDRRGLMIDMSGGTTNAALYLDIMHSRNGTYPLPVPPDPQSLDPQGVANMRLLLQTASYWNGTCEGVAAGTPCGAQLDYQRARWFDQGWGRATVGFTESMALMSPATRASLGFKLMPLADTDAGDLFYADVIGINTTTVGRGTRALAVELANLMASSAVMQASIGPSGGEAPQYLMATRPSVFQALGQQDPIYPRMYALLTGANNPRMFNLGPQARSWLTKLKTPIVNAARSNYACGCDRKTATVIGNNSDAAAICSATCANDGGWNGQWTNTPPAAPSASVCGCRSCPLPTAATAAGARAPSSAAAP